MDIDVLERAVADEQAPAAAKKSKFAPRARAVRHCCPLTQPAFCICTAWLIKGLRHRSLLQSLLQQRQQRGHQCRMVGQLRTLQARSNHLHGSAGTSFVNFLPRPSCFTCLHPATYGLPVHPCCVAQPHT